MNMKNKYFAYLEWEFLEEPIITRKINPTKKLPKGDKEIKIFRDDQYKLCGLIRGKEDNSFFFGRDIGKPGESVDQFNISGSENGGYIKYSIQHCYLRELRAFNKGKDTSWEVDINMFSINRKYKNENEFNTSINWYINGPSKYIFCHSTKRDSTITYFRERFSEKDKTFNSLKSKDMIIHSTDIDFIKIDVLEYPFLIIYVPKKYGPIWSNNIGIEYCKNWGKIPDEEERKIISELCSYIFGRQLLYVGHSIFDNENCLIEEYACNPWGNYPRSLCSLPDMPPIRIDKPICGSKSENLINQLLPSYFTYREPYNLKNALWFFWFAQSMPVDASLSLYFSALEAIMNGWFKSDKSKSKGKFLKEKEFKSIFKEELESIKKKLENKEKEIKDKFNSFEEKINIDFIYNGIRKRLQFINDMGVMDRFNQFFNEINLKVGNKEWDAIRARHSIAHGRASTKDEDIDKFFTHSMIFVTLLNKVILKLLGYSGDYIDRNIIGWNDKYLM